MRSSDSPRGARRRARLLTSLAAAAIACAAWAADPTPGGPASQPAAQALARAQGLLRQVGEQKQQLEAELARQKTATAAAEARAQAAEASLSGKDAELAAGARALERATQASAKDQQHIETLRDRLDKTKEKYAELRATFEQAAAEKERLAAELAAVQGELADAEKKNAALYRANREILDLYKKKPAWTSLLQKEPVTGLAGVDVENRVEKYEFEMAGEVREGAGANNTP